MENQEKQISDELENMQTDSNVDNEIVEVSSLNEDVQTDTIRKIDDNLTEDENPQADIAATTDKVMPINQTPPTRQFTDQNSQPGINPQIYSAQNGQSYQVRQANVQTPKNSDKKGVSFGVCFATAAITSVVSCAVTAIILALLFIPVLSGIIMSDGESDKLTDNNIQTTPQDVVVEGNVVEPGDDVQINIIESNEIASAVYAKANKSVVGITVVSSATNTPWYSSGYQKVGSGSGIIYSEDGHIVTNHHVIEGALSSNGKLASGYEVRVYLDTSLSTYCVASLIGYDVTTDLALLKIDKTGLTPLEIADSDKIEIGETAIVIGSPGGIEFMNSVSSGIVSGLNRNLSTESGVAYNLIQTTAAINPGNSGGALLNSEGQLIGICVLKVAASNYEGMGFAISSNTVKTIVDSISKNGNVQKAWLGVTVNTNYTSTEAAESGLPAGAWVSDVAGGSAADKAGIQSGDIIVEVNGNEVKSFYDLRIELSKHKPNDAIEIKIYRDGKYINATAVLDAE